MKSFVILLSIFIGGSFSTLPEKKNGNQIHIKSVPIETGLISGTLGKDTLVKVFKGIPFAAPPVQAASWKGTRKCDSFSPSAIQNKPTPLAMWTKKFMAPEEPLSEDCLYLNVWRLCRFRSITAQTTIGFFRFNES